MSQNEFRGYVFVNRALSSIQKGVQGTHAMAELFSQYSYLPLLSNTPTGTLYDWVENHKTLVYLDCGFEKDMRENYLIFSNLCDSLKLPHSAFTEDEDTMNCMFTAFAGIVPSTIYDIDLIEHDKMIIAYYTSKGNRDGILPEETNDIQLCRFLKQFKLAI